MNEPLAWRYNIHRHCALLSQSPYQQQGKLSKTQHQIDQIMLTSALVCKVNSFVPDLANPNCSPICEQFGFANWWTICKAKAKPYSSSTHSDEGPHSSDDYKPYVPLPHRQSDLRNKKPHIDFDIVINLGFYHNYVSSLICVLFVLFFVFITLFFIF